MKRCVVAHAGVVLLLALAQGTAQVPPRPPQSLPPGHPGSPHTRPAMFTEAREAAALMFARKNRPELAEVLNKLKDRNRTEYERAVIDLFRTSEMLTTMRERDPAHYKLALQTWQAEMNINLLAARLVRQPDQAGSIQRELHKTVSELIDLRVAQMTHQLERMEKQLAKMREQKKQLASRRDQMIQKRFAAAMQAVKQQRKQND